MRVDWWAQLEQFFFFFVIGSNVIWSTVLITRHRIYIFDCVFDNERFSIISGYANQDQIKKKKCVKKLTSVHVKRGMLKVFLERMPRYSYTRRTRIQVASFERKITQIPCKSANTRREYLYWKRAYFQTVRVQSVKREYTS